MFALPFLTLHRDVGQQLEKAAHDAHQGNNVIDISGCHLGEDNLLQLAQLMVKHPSVNSVFISHCTSSPQGIAGFLGALGERAEPLELRWTCCALDASAVQVLATAVQKHPTLQSLDLSCDNLGAGEADMLARALERNPAVTSLNLEGNAVGDDGAKSLADALVINTCLEHLNLKDTNIGPMGTAAISEALAFKKHGLQHLSLHACPIGDQGAAAVAEMLLTNSALESLDLRNTGIGPTGTRLLSRGLCKGPEGGCSLATLDLRGNDMRDAGASAVADALATNDRLLQLFLGWNGIGPEGARSIARALTGNTTLRRLGIEANLLGAEGAEAIFTSLEINATLRSLDMSNTNIVTTRDRASTVGGEASAGNGTPTEIETGEASVVAALARALRVNVTLEEMDLCGNPAPDDVAASHFLEALALNRSLHSVFLPESPSWANLDLPARLSQNDVLLACKVEFDDMLPAEKRQFWLSVRNDCILFCQFIERRRGEGIADARRFARALFSARRRNEGGNI